MTSRNLALFDLDHTLLPIDSDHEWVEFLIRHQLAGDPEAVRRRNDELYAKYQAGTLTIEESAAVMLGFLKMHSPYDLAKYHEIYMQEVIRPNIKKVATDLVDKHLSNGDLCCLVSATNTFVITPIGRAFAFENIIGTTPEFINGRYTGKFVGTASYKEGKITRVQEWLATLGLSLNDFEKSYFYSDSINDLPLLEKVTHPVATNPQDSLRKIAQEKGWAILDLF
ncbi:HAD family hydrolase [Pelistega suis]|uniref:Histidinol-phosphatase n=1 Tax=Pelistega suis TaxID=1631957 RepID=A0A849P6C8_9BURK|nr:HAD family hydrolase [Pelistega suis]MDY3331511.1 HAD family hydrolase [Pelistega sp.]NOL51108.1 HAD family hydrolase [Pelistega suis]